MNTPTTFLRTLLLTLLIHMPSQAALISDFMEFSLREQPGGSVLLPGRLYTPPEASSGARPLILFLHGSGAAGTDNVSQLNVNIDNLLAEAKRRGAFLYAPQTATTWAARSVTDQVMAMIDRSKVEFPIVSSQIYITGISMGGGGAWNMLNRYGETFAAGIPIAGVGPGTDFNAANLVDEPIWAFHAKDDPQVPVSFSRNRVNGILTAASQTAITFNNDPVDLYYGSPTLDLQYSEFGTGGHPIWNGIYNTPAVYDWMFARTSAIPEPNSFCYVVAAIFLKLTMRRRLTFACKGQSA